MADIDGNLIGLLDNSSSPTVFTENTNSQFSPRGLGNQPISIVPGNYSNNATRFDAQEKRLYRDDADYNKGAPFYAVGAQQPYVIVNPGDSDFKKGIKRFDSRMFPVGSSIQDVERITKFTFSGYGLKFLLLQQLLHFQAPFDETNINDPTSHLVSTGRSLGLGLIPRVTKHLGGGSLLGAVINKLGGKDFGIPNSTVDVSDNVLPHSKGEGSDSHYGLLRGNTATAGFNNLKKIWDPGDPKSSGFFKTLLSKYAPSVGASQPGSFKYRADEDTYSLMIGESNKISTTRLLPVNTLYTTINPFESKERLVEYSAPTETLSIVNSQLGINREGTYSNAVENIRYGLLTNDKSKLRQYLKEYKDTPPHLQNKYGKNPQSRFLRNAFPLLQNDGPEDIQYNSGDPTLSGKKVAPSGNGYEDILSETGKHGSGLVEKKLFKDYQTNYRRRLFSEEDSVEEYPYEDLRETMGRVAGARNKIGTGDNVGGYVTPSNIYYGKLRESAIENKYKFPEYSGKLKTRVSLRMHRPDPITKQLLETPEENQSSLLKDLIKFKFFDVVNQKYLTFRATLKSISNNTTAEWSDMRYVGRADKVYSYNGFTRDLSFNFRVYATSVEDLIPMWKKINYLKTMTYPSNTLHHGGYNINLPPFIKLTMGDLFVKQPLIIKSIALSVPDESSWEIGPPPGAEKDLYRQLPFLVELSLSTTLLEKELPKTGVPIFGDRDDFSLRQPAIMEPPLPADQFDPNSMFNPVDPISINNQYV